MASVLCVEKLANCSWIFVQTTPRKSCQNLPFTVCWISCTNLLNCCLGMCAKLLSPSLSCLEISLAFLLSFSQSAHERIESNVIFSSFSSLNITPSDFWVIPKSNGWNRFRSMAEIECSFKSPFYFLIHPTLKTHLAIYFQSHFSFLIFHWLYKSHFKIRLSNFIT